MLTVQDISLSYGQKQVLDQVRLAANVGKITALVGPNGAGKTSLFRVITGELTSHQGSVLLNGKELKAWSGQELAQMRAVLPQHSELLFAYPALEIVEMGRMPYKEPTGISKSIAWEAMCATRTEHLWNRSYLTLSGGEQQRVQLARVLAQIWEESGQDRLLLLDEPTASQDLAHQYEILHIARQFADKRTAIVAILHDLNLAAQVADHLIFLKKGKVVAAGSVPDVFTAHHIEQTFDQAVHVMPHPELDCPMMVAKPRYKKSMQAKTDLISSIL